MLDRIRIDDVMWESGDEKLQGHEVSKFKKHIEWCEGTGVLITPAILCQDIENFPEVIPYLKEKIDAEVIYPDLHGWDHGPYGDRPQAQIEEHLDKSMEWFKENLGVYPVRWVTPHGANSKAIQDAARKYYLTVEDTKPPVIDQRDLDRLLRTTKNVEEMKGRVLMIHWWQRGLAVFRISEIIKAGGIEAAKGATKISLDEKTWRSCWNEW